MCVRSVKEYDMSNAIVSSNSRCVREKTERLHADEFAQPAGLRAADRNL
jgi:hypothetical protein